MTRSTLFLLLTLAFCAEQSVCQEASLLKPPVIGAQLDGLSPKDALAAFRAYDGFHVVQSAAEPDVRQPVAMTIDERGRVWIAEAYEYPIRADGDTGRDRILIFEDKDGDGVFDERKVFMEGLNLVSGLEVGFGGVWVGAAPYLMFIPDADRDDKPDGKSEILLDGFGWQDTHETLNSFTWGPDGWLYGCHGVFTHSKVGKPGMTEAERIPLNAGIWRYHPQKKIFEVFAHGTSNPWGIDFNDQGQAFVTACVIPHLFHIIQGGRYHRQAGSHFDPHTYDDIKTCADHLHYTGDQWANSRDGSSSSFGGGHAHCGLSIYMGDNFPDMFRGRLFFNNLHGHRINQERLEKNGSGYIGKHEPDFLFSNDRQHMGVALRYGPDGGLYLTDWYDSQTCHNVTEEVWNRSNGRIYKITYGKPKRVAVDLANVSDMDLVKYQSHKNEWFVRTARRMLQERAAAGTLDAQQVSEALELLLSDADGSRRLRGLWALHGIRALSEKKLLGLLSHHDEYIRAWSIQLLGEGASIDDEILSKMASLGSQDPSPVVRLYLASILQRLRPEQRWDIATALLAREEDASDQNLPLVLWYGISDLFDTNEEKASKFLDVSKLPKVTSFIARRLGGSASGRELLMEEAQKNVGNERLNEEILEGIAAALLTAGEVATPNKWKDASPIFSSLKGDRSRRNFESVATAFGDRQMAEKLKKVMGDLSEKSDLRLSAWTNLQRMRLPGTAGFLIEIVNVENDPLRAKWIEGMASNGDERIIKFLADRLLQLKGKEKEAAVLVLCGTESGATILAKALSSGELPRDQVSAFVARQMRGFGNPEISTAVETYWGKISEGAAEDKLKDIETWKQRLTPASLKEADLRNGRRIYEQTCFACHRLFGEGMIVGPDLTGSNRRDIGYLLENIIDPGSLVGLDYQLHTVTKKDGTAVTGMLKKKTDDASIFAMIGGGQVIVRNEEIANHEVSAASMMPEGLIANLSELEVRDLIGYLGNERQVPLPVENEVIINNDSLDVAEVNRGSVSQQNMAAFKEDRWSEDSQIWWTQGDRGDRLVLSFQSEQTASYEVLAVFTKAPDYGSFRVSVNGEVGLKEIDLFEPGRVVTTGEVSLGIHQIVKGKNLLVAELLGANPDASPGMMLGIDHLRLVPSK